MNENKIDSTRRNLIVATGAIGAVEIGRAHV